MRELPVIIVERPFKDVDHAVVITLRQRIIFMTVAPGASNSEAQDARSDDVHFIGNHIQPILD